LHEILMLLVVNFIYFPNPHTGHFAGTFLTFTKGIVIFHGNYNLFGHQIVWVYKKSEIKIYIYNCLMNVVRSLESIKKNKKDSSRIRSMVL